MTLGSNVLEGYNANEIVEALKAELSDYPVEPASSGSSPDNRRSRPRRWPSSRALVIALFLIFLIIVAQFNSISTPFIIGFSVLFSLTGSSSDWWSSARIS